MLEVDGRRDDYSRLDDGRLVKERKQAGGHVTRAKRRMASSRARSRTTACHEILSPPSASLARARPADTTLQFDGRSSQIKFASAHHAATLCDCSLVCRCM